MSLMLRQACEEPLSEAGLGNYHAGIETSYGCSKDLALYSNCGQLFLIVPGINFGSIRLKNSEVEYSAQLLTQWLRTNRKKIDRYLAALENREVHQEPTSFDDGSLSIHFGTRGGYGSRIQGILVDTGQAEYVLDQKGNVLYVEVSFNKKPVPVNRAVVPTIAKTQLKQIEAWTTQYFNAKAAEKQLEEARKALSESCALV